MREDIALALDGSAVALVALALWLACHRRSSLTVLFGVIGLAVMSGTAALRAYASPAHAALQQTAGELRAELITTTEKRRKAETVGQVLRADVAKLTNPHALRTGPRRI